MENEDARIYDDAARFPFLHDVLLRQAARATAFADPLAHETPSQPHYIWMEAGTNTLPDHTFHDDSPPSTENSTASGEHLVAQIAAAGNGADWMSYQEGIDAESGACPVASSGLYRPRHNPFVFFHDVAGSPPSKTAPVCIAHHKPLSALAGDLAAGAVKAYNFISPDLCHDGHGAPGCPRHGGVSPGDAWMREALPPLIAFVNAHEGVLFIVWDEGATSAVIPFLALGPHVKAGYAGGVPYDHRSLVKSIEKILGLPFLPAVAAANDFGNLFEAGLFP